MKRKINLIGYPQFNNNKLSSHQKKEFKKLKSRFRKQSKQNKFELYASGIEGIQVNAWNFVFYDFSEEQLLDFKQMVRENKSDHHNIFFLNSEFNFLHWLDNIEFKHLGIAGCMSTQSTYLLISGSLTHKIFPFAFIDLTQVLQKLPNLKGCIQEANGDTIYCYKEGQTKELIYAVLDLDKVYSRVNLNLEYFIEFVLLYMQTTESTVIS
ncbi:hypothetical protein [uncultured Microscilla sp.]|uniref:hypothetical protein n=1 Tax=uncultured Microscilla sp. TaxID=432653 RepID=UPI002637C8ED|nr:hypothetical protein [uncultured Microscilla sp.]